MKVYQCKICGATENEEDLALMWEFDDTFILEESLYICPGCYPDISSKDLETILNGKW